MASSVAKLQSEIRALTGVDIMKDDDTFKSTFQILQEISQVWDKLTDVSRANVLNLLGSKRNANVLSSLITNFKDAIEASETAGESSGSAWAENEKYLNSIEGKTKQVQAAFEALSTSVVQSNFIKTFLDAERAILNVATALNNVGALLPTLVAVGGALKSMSDISKATTAINQVQLWAGQGTEASMAKIFSLIDGMKSGQLKSFIAQLDQIESKGDALNQVGAYAQAAASGMNVFGSALDKAKAKVISFGVGLKAFATSIPGIITIVMAVVSGVRALVSAFEAARQARIDAANAAADTYTKGLESYRSQIDELVSMQSRFNELSQHVTQDGQNIDLPTEEYNEYLGMLDRAVAISPSIVSSYTEQGYVLRGTYVNAINDAIEAQRRLNELQRDAWLAKGDDWYSGIQDQLKTVNSAAMAAGQELQESIIDAFLISNADQLMISDYLGQVADVFKEFGVELYSDMDSDIYKNATNALMAVGYDINSDEAVKIYENREKILQRLSGLTVQVTDETGKLVNMPLFDSRTFKSETEIGRMIGGFSESITQYEALRRQVAQYVLAYVDSEVDAFSDIPVDKIAALQRILTQGVNLDWSLNKNAQYAREATELYMDALEDISNARGGVITDEVMEAHGEMERVS